MDRKPCEDSPVAARSNVPGYTNAGDGRLSGFTGDTPRSCPKESPGGRLTAFAMQGDRERAIDAGFDDYITKPVTGAKLKAQLDAVPSSES